MKSTGDVCHEQRCEGTERSQGTEQLEKGSPLDSSSKRGSIHPLRNEALRQGPPNPAVSAKTKRHKKAALGSEEGLPARTAPTPADVSPALSRHKAAWVLRRTQLSVLPRAYKTMCSKAYTNCFPRSQSEPNEVALQTQKDPARCGAPGHVPAFLPGSWES